MQHLVWHRWHELRRRISGELEPAMARLSARRAELGVAVALAIFIAVAGGASLAVVTVGLVATLAWALRRPAEAEEGREHTVAAGHSPIGGDRQWRLLVDAVPEPAVVLDRHGVVLHANRPAEDLLGARRRGAHIASMIRDPELLAAVDHGLTEGSAGSVELQERVPVERRLLATVAPLHRSLIADDGPALLIAFRDLSEQDRLTRMRADFVANASHELRTPLASLRGFVETLQGAAKDDAQARERFLKVMGEQAERMTRLIDDLLSLSRVEMREHLTPAESVDLNNTAAHVAQSLQPIASEAGTSIDLQLLPAPAIVRGDSDEIVQVFQNLVQNAIKYGKRDGHIKIAVGREPASGTGPARYVVSVADDGPGIAPQHLPRLTERFYRVNVAASREKGGTGLGLAIVKHILNRHRGELQVTSRVGRGSTFTVTLPALEGAPDRP